MWKLAILGVLAFGLSSRGMAVERKVLIALSGSDSLSLVGGGKHKTGVFLSELTEAVLALKAKAYEIHYANPSGREAAIDPDSDAASWFPTREAYLKAKTSLLAESGFHHPRSFKSISEKELESYAAIFIPGGYAPMEDLVADKELGRILNHFHKQQKPTALICHGPVALLSQKIFANDGSWAYTDYRLTIVSKAEELEEENAGHLGGKQLYYVQTALEQAGAKVQVAKAWSSHLVQDREVITGQNPMSAKALVAQLMQVLAE